MCVGRGRDKILYLTNVKKSAHTCSQRVAQPPQTFISLCPATSPTTSLWQRYFGKTGKKERNPAWWEQSAPESRLFRVEEKTLGLVLLALIHLRAGARSKDKSTGVFLGQHTSGAARLSETDLQGNCQESVNRHTIIHWTNITFLSFPASPRISLLLWPLLSDAPGPIVHLAVLSAARLMSHASAGSKTELNSSHFREWITNGYLTKWCIRLRVIGAGMYIRLKRFKCAYILIRWDRSYRDQPQSPSVGCKLGTICPFHSSRLLYSSSWGLIAFPQASIE